VAGTGPMNAVFLIYVLVIVAGISSYTFVGLAHL
jgi:hypothetical protein